MNEKLIVGLCIILLQSFVSAYRIVRIQSNVSTNTENINNNLHSQYKDGIYLLHKGTARLIEHEVTWEMLGYSLNTKKCK